MPELQIPETREMISKKFGANFGIIFAIKKIASSYHFK